MTQTYLEPTQELGAAFMRRGIPGQFIMLNLLKFKAVADYSHAPELAPETPISGETAFKLYIRQTLPHLKKTGGDIVLLGKGGQYLIGPADKQWDFVMLIKQNSVTDFISFASNPDYLKILAHRIAAVEDSRLLPFTEEQL